MAKITINNKKISKTDWGDVSKSDLGNRLASAYADGEATKAVINEAYAFVPANAFSGSGDEKKFAYTKAWGPHHELSGDTLIVNRGGVFAAAAALAGARSQPNLTSAEKAKARRHLRKHYRAMKEEIPDSLKESLGVVERGDPIEELVKGSLEYTFDQIRRAFYKQFPRSYDSPWFYIVETFADHVIVSHEDLDPDEFYLVTYEREDSDYVFAGMDDWEVVELAYQPRTEILEAAGGKDRRFNEQMEATVQLVEGKGDKGRKVKAIGITADVINGNRRRYPAYVLEAAVAELKSHLHESAGQARAIQLLGEAEHPSSKGGRANILETVVKWEAVSFDGKQVLLEGAILPTSKGRDILTLLEGGVNIPISQRAYGSSKIIKEDGLSVEEVTELHITGYDLVVEASDPVAAILESQGELDMELNLEVLREKYPELVHQIEAEHDKKKKAELEEQLRRQQEHDEEIQRAMAERDKALRDELGLRETDDLEEAVKARNERLAKLEEQDQIRKVGEYIEEQTKDLKYPAWLLEKMVAAVKEAQPKTVDEAKVVIVAKRKEYDGIMADLELQAKGWGAHGVDILGPVLEKETGTPEYARVAFELTESIREDELRERRDFRKPKTVNEEFTALYLKKFDKQYQAKLIAEAKLFAEAEQTTDLNLPYSVSRAIIAEAFPNLVAAGIFDVGLVDTSPFRLYFEDFSGETGYTGSVTDESFSAPNPLGTWVALANKRLTPGTVVVTTDPTGTTYTEGTDYVIDYANGEIFVLSGGSIAAGAALLIDYDYTAIRKGEMSPIERGKITLSFVTVDAKADRLADQISSEAIVFSRSQLGMDAVTRTLTSLINQVRRKIDQGLIYMGLAAALKVANNSGGTWTAATDSYLDFVEKTGVAKVKVANRYYTPTFLLLSTTNADKIANWDGFTQAGSRPDADLNAEGYVGRLKSLNTFQSTEMSDAYGLVGNRQLVMHRIYQALQIKGPYPTYDVSGGTSKLVAADQYYTEEYNATEAPVSEKGAYVVIA